MTTGQYEKKIKMFRKRYKSLYDSILEFKAKNPDLFDDDMDINETEMDMSFHLLLNGINYYFRSINEKKMS